MFKGDLDHVALSVVKKVEDPETQVDCVTGATLTSNGVNDMLHDGLKWLIQPVKEYFEKEGKQPKAEEE